ncbi:putative metalloprotease CJM1_0395 family protein [Paraglaciecola aestuariivivens]
MNIVAPVPIPIVFNAGTVNTESVRRDNTQREAIPQLAANEQSAAETAVGSESDKVKTPGQAPAPLTYEKPVIQANQQPNTQSSAEQDNGQDESAGKENAEQQQQQQAEQQKITELKQRDAEVRSHEQAHAAAGGQYAESPQYEYVRGPDGKQYAVDGEVAIDVSEASTPEETIRKAQQVKAAALAPTEPSAQDLRVANEATQIALEARNEIARERAEKAQQAYEKATTPSESTEASQPITQSPELDEIVDGLDVNLPTRTLDTGAQGEDELGLQRESVLLQAQPFITKRELEISRRVSVIEGFYQKVANPSQASFQQSA